MDPNARLQVNLNVLRKHDASITEIIDRCSHVVVYGFKEPVKWTKSNIEGTLFLFKRSKSPTYGFFIMNRLGVENVMCFMTENVELQITPEYIIYRADQAIQPDGNLVYGLWVFESDDRDRVAKKLVNLKSISNETPTPAPATPAKNSLPSTSSGSNSKSSSDDRNIDIVGLLQKAFDAHNVKSSAASSSAQRSTHVNTSARNKSSPLQPQGASLLKGVDLDGKFLLSLIQPEGDLSESSALPSSGAKRVETTKNQQKSSEERLNSSEDARRGGKSAPRNSKKTPSSTSVTNTTTRTQQQPASSSAPPQMTPGTKVESQPKEQGRPSQGRHPFSPQQEPDNPKTHSCSPPGLSQPTQHPTLGEQQPPQPIARGSQIPQQSSQDPAQPPMQQHAVHPPPHPIFPIPLPPPGAPLSPHMMPFLPGAFPMLPPGGLLYPPHAAAAAGTAFAARFYGKPGGAPISKDEFVGALFNLMQNDPLFMNFAYQTYLNSPKP